MRIFSDYSGVHVDYSEDVKVNPTACLGTPQADVLCPVGIPGDPGPEGTPEQTIVLPPEVKPEDVRAPIRTFETGATRDTDEGKFDYEGFLSPIVLHRFAAYMHQHRKQADGTLRTSDNWKRGIPKAQYLKSLLRHVTDVWLIQTGYPNKAVSSDLEDALCAVLFNVMGLLHETIKENDHANPPA